MPIYLIRLFLILFSVAGYCQTKKVFYSIPWQDEFKIINLNGKIYRALHFEEALYLPGDSGLPTLTISIPFSEVDKCKIKSTLYIPMRDEERSLIPVFFKDEVHQIRSNVFIKDQKSFSNIRIIPIRWNEQGQYYEKLISFELEYMESNKVVKSLNLREESDLNSSVLSAGDWYKVKIDKDGIYKIDFNFLRNIGIDPTSIDPQKIKIYGYGGGMLPQANSAPRQQDLPQNSIFVSGELDKTFDEEDYIIFYGEGPDKWSFDSSARCFVHEKNLYSESSFYYLTISEGLGKRVSTEASVFQSGNEIRTFTERHFFEPEEHNILHSGRKWFGPIFKEQLKQTFSIPLFGVVPNTFVKIATGLASISSVPTSFNISANGTPLKPVSFSIYNSFPPYTNIGESKESKDSLKVIEPTLSLEFVYDSNKDPLGSNGYLDYYRVNYERSLVLGKTPLLFRSVKSIQYPISDFIIDSLWQTSFVWDVTNPKEVKNIPLTFSQSFGKFTRPSSSIIEYAAFNPKELSSPLFIEKIANQDLHGIASDIPQCIIVSPRKFVAQAERLAGYRTLNGIKTKVVTPEQIYNEFSSGRQDISAIRDFLKFVYDKDQNGLKYLLLFGLASYDYKDRVSNNTNHVPVYESRESLHRLDSYSSDDYFGFLDDYEGEWSEYNNDHLLNLGIGRLPINNESEAEIVVSKIINYEKNAKSLGKWRTGITFIADDGDNNLHVLHAEILSKLVSQNLPDLNIDKIYIDAYPQVTTTRGEIAPLAKERVEKAFGAGSLIINYSGHGGETGLTSEQVIDQSTIRGYKNNENLPFLITATCEFGRYDNPHTTSAAVLSITSRNGGTIGNLTSTREAFASSNLKLNTAFYNSLFRGGPEQTLGDIFKNTKNDRAALNESVNNRNYVILGDPCLRLAFPKERIAMTTFQDSVVSSSYPTVSPLSRISLTGKVASKAGDNLSFNGIVNVRMFEQDVIYSTQGTDGGFPTTFSSRSKVFHESNTKVSNGTFSLSMIVPKDILYDGGSRKISFYANDSLLNDAIGSFTGFSLGRENVQLKDTIPPKVSLTIAGADSLNGYQTLKDVLLNIRLTDERGINTSTVGVGHEITAVLDGQKPRVLNEYFYSENNDSTSGIVRFPFTSLARGKHTIKVKAWDTSNNSTEELISFLVVDKYDVDGPVIKLKLRSPGLDSSNFTSSTALLSIEVTDSNKVAFIRNVREVEVYVDGNRIPFFENLAIQDEGKRVVGSGFINGLQPGQHFIRVKAYDIFNNSSEFSMVFTVIDKSDTIPPKIMAFIGRLNLDSLEGLQLPLRLRATINDDSKIAFIKSEREIEVTLDGLKIPVFDSCLVTQSGKQIELSYIVDNLLPGRHYLTIEAWDIYGNRSDTTLVFTITKQELKAFYKFYNYPNPLKEWTTFHLEQNHLTKESGIGVIEIYSLTGTLVKKLESVIDAGSVVSEINWRRTDDANNKLPDGIYFYRIVLRSKTVIIENHNYQKLVIVN